MLYAGMKLTRCYRNREATDSDVGGAIAASVSEFLEPSDPRNQPRIAVFGCGGTIAMGGAVGPLSPKQSANQLLSVLPELTGLAVIETDDLMNKDSSNMRPLDWKRIADSIHKAARACDACVITHGTDTMVFTAAALAIAFGNSLPCPVVMTGSQRPIGHPLTDAKRNLVSAFQVAIDAHSRHIREVMIAFGSKVLLGCCARKRSATELDAFDSPGSPPLATLLPDQPVRLSIPPRPPVTRHSDFCSDFSAGILSLRLVPGMNLDPIAENAARDDRITGAVIEPFGCGNIPNEAGLTVIEFIGRMTGAGKPVVLTSPFPGEAVNMDDYETGAAARKAGAISAMGLTPEMATVTLMWLLAQGRSVASIKELMEGIDRSKSTE